MKLKLNGHEFYADAVIQLMDDELREELHHERDWVTDLVECRTADGWSLHAPGATDEEIADGTAEPLAYGPGSPTAEDRMQAAEQAFLNAYCVEHSARFGSDFVAN